MRHVTARQMQVIDRKAIDTYGIPSLLLMENAGRAVAMEALKKRPPFVVLYCGAGNNGGDGFVAARHLANHGVRCTVLYFQPRSRMKPDPSLNFHILKKMRIPCLRWAGLTSGHQKLFLNRTDLIIDALFGTGLTRPVEGEYLKAVRQMNRSRRPILSVDVPSGMDADTGAVLGECVRADWTVTLALPKRAFKNRAARALTGRIVVADISIPAALLR